VFGIFVSFLQIAALVNAFVRSLAQRFLAGMVGAAVRALLLAGGIFGWLWDRHLRVPGSDLAGPAAAAWMVTAAAVLGPLVSFVVLFLAHRRTRDVPAAKEEEAARVFAAWLPVGLLDALFVAINVFAALVAKPF
jgi:hypothetical protein